MIRQLQCGKLRHDGQCLAHDKQHYRKHSDTADRIPRDFAESVFAALVVVKALAHSGRKDSRAAVTHGGVLYPAEEALCCKHKQYSLDYGDGKRKRQRQRIYLSHAGKTQKKSGDPDPYEVCIPPAGK